MGTLDLFGAELAPPAARVRGKTFTLSPLTRAQYRAIDAAIPRPVPPRVLSAAPIPGAPPAYDDVKDPGYLAAIEAHRDRRAAAEVAVAMRWEPRGNVGGNVGAMTSGPSFAAWLAAATGEIDEQLSEAEVAVVLGALRDHERKVIDMGKVSTLDAPRTG